MKTDVLRDTWVAFRKEHNCSIDRMLCCPALRSAFVESAMIATESNDEEEILWALLDLRKSKGLKSSK